MSTYSDGAYRTFKEASVGALDEKEGYAVALDSAEECVKLATGAADSIGIMSGKLQNGAQGDGAVSVRLLGKGGTVKVVAGGAIDKGELVMSASGGKVVVATTAARAIGRKLTQGTSADGDVIEIIDNIEVAP